jgi:hypothetical protein
MSFWANVVWANVTMGKRLMGKRRMGKCHGTGFFIVNFWQMRYMTADTCSMLMSNDHP